MNLVELLVERSLGRRVESQKLQGAMEYKFNTEPTSMDYPLQPEIVLSTIAIAISSDGELVASTHGDHTVKVFRHHSASLVHVFHGHPRTPWTVKFHPTDSNFVASGCLGCEVRVWNIAKKYCQSVVRLEYSIISLAFQPSLNGDCGPYIAVASGPHLHMWEWKNPVYNVRQGAQNLGLHQHDNSPYLIHSRNIRAVMFHPTGKIVFAAAPDPPRVSNVPSSPCRLYAIQAEKEFVSSCTETLNLSDFPALIPQIHLYSDGGMDISPDGQYLFTCALLNVDSLNSVADTRVYNEDSRLCVGDSRDKNSLPFSSALDHITSAFMKYVNMADTDSHEQVSQNTPQSARNVDQIQFTLDDMSHSNTLAQRLDDLHRHYIQPSTISTNYLTALNISSTLESGGDSSRVPPIAFADPKVPSPEGVSRWQVEERLCLFKLDFDVDNFPNSALNVYLVNSTPLSEKLMRAVTSIKLSPTGRYGLIGYGVRNNGIVENHAHKKVACEVIDLMTMESQSVMADDVDEVNIAQFHPLSGCGIIYGTKRGRVRMYF